MGVAEKKCNCFICKAEAGTWESLCTWAKQLTKQCILVSLSVLLQLTLQGSLLGASACLGLLGVWLLSTSWCVLDNLGFFTCSLLKQERIGTAHWLTSLPQCSWCSQWRSLYRITQFLFLYSRIEFCFIYIYTTFSLSIHQLKNI